MSLIQFDQVSFRYPKGPVVFEDLDLDIEQGEILGILGPNGSGKSTLLDLLTMYHKPSSGRIYYDGIPIEQSRFFHEVGCVFQSISLDAKLTVYENLWLQGRILGMERRSLKDRIAALAAQFQIDLILDRPVYRLSGGFARRVEIAKAMIHGPRLILLDEPSTGLDPKARLDLFEWLVQVKHGSDVTVIWVSHLTDEVQKMDRVIMLHEGNITCDGSPHMLIDELEYVHIHAKLKDPEALDKIESFAKDISLNGDQVQCRVIKNKLQESIDILLPSVEHMSYREPNLEDVFLERTGVYFS